MSKKISPLYSVLVVLSSVFFFLSYNINPPNGHTGAPPTSATCSSENGGCHSLDGANSIGDITISGLPSTILQGTTYPITVSVNRGNSTPKKGGFQLLVLDANNNNSGALSNPGTSSFLETFSGKTYFEHHPAVLFGSNNSVFYTVDWKAPSTGTGLISMYAAGNLADATNHPDNDLIVTTIASGILTAPPVCDTPTGPVATPNAGGALNALLSWNAAPTAVSYKVNVVKGTGNTTLYNVTLTTSNTSLTVNSFPAPGKYKFRVQSVCSGGLLSAWTVYKSFKMGACGTVSGLTAMPASSTSAMLGWTSLTAASSYSIDVRHAPGNPNAFSTIFSSTTNSLTVNGLPGPGNFRFRVRSVCNGLNGNWSVFKNFTMPGSNLMSDDGLSDEFANFQLFPNPASGGEVQLALKDFAGEKENLYVSVFNMDMRPLKEITLKNWSGENYQMDVSEMETGVYFIQVKAGDKNKVKRLLILR